MMSHKVSVATLITLLTSLCEQGSIRQALDGDAFTAPHMPILEGQLGQLVSAQLSAADTTLATLGVELGALDTASDRDSSALVGLLRSSAALLEDDDPALAQALTEAADVMEGDGLIQLTRARYDAIGGHAAQREQRMGATQREALEALKLGPNHTALDRFERWVSRAVELSGKEVTRAGVAAQRAAQPTISPADLARLKRDTIHRLNRLIDAVGDSALSGELRAAILSPLQKASDEARAL
jgi:hypothetical protein